MHVLYIGKIARFGSKINEILALQNYKEAEHIEQISKQDELFTDGEINIKIHSYDLIFLDMDIGWNKNEFEILIELRKQGVLYPIVLVVDELREAMETELSWKVVNTPGHYLWEYSEQALNKPLDINYRLSKEALDDIFYSVFDKKGALENFLHDLKNSIGSGTKVNWTDVTEAIKDFYVSQTPPMKPPVARIEELVQRIIEDPQIHNIDSLADAIKVDFEYQSDDLSGQETPWKILFIDDERHTRVSYQKVFQEVANIKCEIAGSGSEAYKILDQNLEAAVDPITVIITDYRFYEDNGRTWQKDQGYDIITTVYEKYKSRPLGYFLLTSKRNVLMRSSQYNKLPHIQSYEKGNLGKPLEYQERVKVFIDAIRNEGNRAYNSILEGPKSASWVTGYTKAYNKSPLKEYYYKYIQDRSFYEETESHINQSVLALIQRVENPNIFKESRIESLKELRTIFRFMNYKMGDNGILLQAKIAKPSTSKEGIEQFAWGILFPRRVLIATYLSFYRTAIMKKKVAKSFDHIDDIVTCMIDFQDQDYVSAGSIKQVLNNRLCLGKKFEKRVRNELLREERQFFESNGWLE